MEAPLFYSLILLEYGEWSEWDECSATCGGGVQYRERNVTVHTSGNSTYTTFQGESQVCSTQPCPPGTNDFI